MRTPSPGVSDGIARCAVAAATPKELYDRIISTEVYVGDGFLRPAVQSELTKGTPQGAWRFANPEIAKVMPMWNWNDLARFSKILHP